MMVPVPPASARGFDPAVEDLELISGKLKSESIKEPMID